MGRLFRFVVSGKSVAELKDNMSRALDELNGEETTTREVPQDFLTQAAAQPSTFATTVMPPTPSVAPAPTATNPSGVDSMGLPWDERIHSSNMAKTKDGSWRTRRGVEPAYVRQIEHELIDRIKNGGAAQAPTFQAPPVPAAPPAPIVPPLQPSAPVAPLGNVSPPPQALTVPAAVVAPPMAPPIAPSIATPVAPPMPPVTSAHSLETFVAQFVPTLAALVNDGKLSPEYVAALKNYFKVEAIYDVSDAQKAEMFETFCKAGILTKVG